MAAVSNGLARVSSQMALNKRTVADADPPHIWGRPKRDGVVIDPPVPIRRGKGGSMSGRWHGQRGRPVPDAES